MLGFLLALYLLDAVLATVSISLIVPITSNAVGAPVPGLDWMFSYIPESFKADLAFLLLIMGVLLFVQFLVSAAAVGLSTWVTEDMRLKWKQAMTAQAIRRPLGATLSDRQGAVVNDLVYETDIASGFVFNYLTYLSQLVVLFGMVGLLLAVNWVWLAVCAAGGVVLWMVAGRPYFRFAGKLGKKAIGLNQSMNAIVFESLNGIKDIKISGAEEFQLGKIHQIAVENNTNRKLKKISQATPKMAKDFVLAAVVLLIALFIPKDLEQIKNIMPQIALFIVAFGQIATSVSVIAGVRFKVLSRLPSFMLVVDKILRAPVAPEDLDKGVLITDFGGRIVFQDIGFSYGGEQNVFEGLNLDIIQGQTICIIGPSGAGKTTLIDLLSRLYDPAAGRIGADAGDAGAISLQSWRGLIGYVPQEPMMYYGTIRENITLGKSGITDEDINVACRKAGIEDFIQGLPMGLDSVLSEKGNNLSGGQKKRIALARALARHCRIIILDETTNAIQEQAEREIIRNLQEDKTLTIIIISHRDSTANLADACYRIENKRITPVPLPYEKAS